MSAAILIAVMFAGCGWVPADEQVLTKFFEQSRLYDTTRVARVAKVVFDPRVEGVIERYRITSRKDEPVDAQTVRRRSMLATRVRTAQREYDRTLEVTMERNASGRWMILSYRWLS